MNPKPRSHAATQFKPGNPGGPGRPLGILTGAEVKKTIASLLATETDLKAAKRIKEQQKESKP